MSDRRWIGWGVFLACAAGILCGQVGVAQKAAAPTGPIALQVDDLTTPMGIDDPAPKFSWQLHDPARGARQTAYQVIVIGTSDQPVMSSPALWTSDRVESSQSINVRYNGPALKPFTGYYWTVEVWGADGKRYQGGTQTWFETGLMNQDAWTAQWIGYETTEEAAVRKAQAKWIVSPDASALGQEKKYPEQFAYRTQVTIEKKVKSAALYATGQDTVSAWVDGAQVLEAAPFPAWHQMPWKKFVRADVTGKLAEGGHTIAIESVLYSGPSFGAAAAPPVIATLYVEYEDGTTATFDSSEEWKTAIHAADGWHEKSFDDSGWKNAGLLKQQSGPMAAPLGHPWIPDSVKALRHEFDVSKPVKSARLYSTAMGEYEMFLNGKRVSEDVFAPGWTDYRERVAYQTYDVTELVKSGRNAIGALLAPGWYATPLEWFQQPNNYGDTPPALRAQLRIEYPDGSVDWVATDPTWTAGESFITHSELYDGETQDGRRVWQTIGSFVNSVIAKDWTSAIAIEPKKVDIVAQDFQPIRVERTMAAKTVSEPKAGVYVYDFGQNMAGVEHLRISGPRGTDVRVRFAEILNSDGTIYTENLRTAKATDRFILAGNGVEAFTPQFTFHGFRYAEITGVKTAPGKDALTVEVIHTNAPMAAELKTGSAMVNQLWSNILWGQRSNFVGIPTDCPQRDERLGWMADAQVFWRTASYNMDLAAFSRKFGADMRGTQAGTTMYGIYSPGTARENAGFGPGWSDAGVIIPWTSWLQTGDTSVIDQNWDAMTAYVGGIDKANPDGLWKNEGGIPFGDWLAPEGRTNQVLIASAQWAYDATLLREMARATGRTADEQKYAAMFEKIRAAFQKQFVHDDGFVAGADHGPNFMGERTHDTKPGVDDTQTGYVLALHMNLLPENLRAAAAQKLVGKIAANHGLLATGFLGTPYLLEELTKAGHADVAYQLLLNTQYPSWGYLVDHGATTTWERWNGDQMKNDPSMNSYNHYAYGAVADWIYRYAAGVDATPLDAGFHTVVLHPQFDKRMGSVDFTYPSAYGVIHSAWTVQGTTATWHVAIPANATGWLGVSAAQAAKYKLAGKPLGASSDAKAATRDGQSGFELEPGSYTFTVEL